MYIVSALVSLVNTLRLPFYWHFWMHFLEGKYISIFLKENTLIPLQMSLTFACKIRININIPTSLQKMACRRLGNPPLSEPMVVSLLTHTCVTRPQWVKYTAAVLHASETWVLFSRRIPPCKFMNSLNQDKTVLSLYGNSFYMKIRNLLWNLLEFSNRETWHFRPSKFEHHVFS